MVIVLMGVTGSGKTTVGTTLAERLGWKYFDADEFHSPDSVAKMRAGIPLDDVDRQPWLERLRQIIRENLDAGDSAVLACSALKQSYRDVLAINGDVHFVYLKGDGKLIAERLQARGNHYMNPKLLDSQFETLEEPENALEIDIRLPVEASVEKIRTAFAL